MIIVERTDPHHPQATALLNQSHALMTSLFPPEDNFFLEIGDLVADDIHFFTGRVGDQICGTGALKVYADYGEVKSMFVAETARGKGVADAVLRQIVDQAIDAKLPMIKLETGNLLHAAHRLYARHGFVPCGPFGDYAAANSSVCLDKALCRYSAFFASAAAFIRASNSSLLGRCPNGFFCEPCALCSVCFGAFLPNFGAPAAL
jgi:putative acetyltransferase